MTLPGRKRVELREKVASIRREFEQWKDESEAGKPLRKHHTQIRSVIGTLEPFVESVEAQVVSAALSDEAVLGRTARLELQVLDLHRIWEFFRSKLALRYAPSLREYLAAADDFAWACYEPVTKLRGADRRKEPPLVFFNGGWSPFTWPRGTSYVAESVADGLPPAQFREALRRLPIHVIGIPWVQIAHLPEMSVIGHEVGHDVEVELDLLPELAAAARKGLGRRKGVATRRPGWIAWLREVFADVYGTLATGPAYARTLADFLAGPTAFVASEEPNPTDWGEYPPRGLRVLVTVETLRKLGLTEDADHIDSSWTTAFPRDHLRDYERDVKPLVGALLAGPYEALGGGLQKLVSFGPDERKDAWDTSKEARLGYELPSEDVRCLVAAARFAFDAGPDAYFMKRVPEVVHRQIDHARGVGTRKLSPAEEKSEHAAREKRDAEAGQELLQYIEQAEAAPAEGGSANV